MALAECGFYDGHSFHRVLPGFVAQAGDPQTKTNHGDFDGLGSGGPGYQFEVEFPTGGQPYDQYMVAMANAMQYDPATGEITGGPIRNGSQFFVDLDDLPAGCGPTTASRQGGGRHRGGRCDRRGARQRPERGRPAGAGDHRVDRTGRNPGVLT